MGTAIIIIVLAAIVIIAVVSGGKHMKGEGGCCGGSSDKPERKKLTDPVIGKRVIHIEGMHCQNCQNSVQRQLNRIDGVSAEVKLKKKCAVVSMTRMIPDAELKAVVERLDFQVTGITGEEA